MKLGRLLSVALAAVLVASVAFAQSKTTTAPKPGQPGQKGNFRARSTMGPNFFEKLKLSPTQKTKIEAIMNDTRKKFEALRNQKLTEDQRRTKFKTLRDDQMKKIDAVLTAAQRKQLVDMRKKAQAEWKKKGGTFGAPEHAGKGGGL
ncbi:MAG: hypothetical protein U0R49_02995 [Fimbriimonadales bacterium]